MNQVLSVESRTSTGNSGETLDLSKDAHMLRLMGIGDALELSPPLVAEAADAVVFRGQTIELVSAKGKLRMTKKS